MGNHDFSRIVSIRKRWGVSTRVGQAFSYFIIDATGTPYVYQGDEIGMTNVAHDSIDLYDDVETRNAWKAAEAAGKDMDKFLKAVHWQSRDNARTPMQWDATPQAGFTAEKTLDSSQ